LQFQIFLLVGNNFKLKISFDFTVGARQKYFMALPCCVVYLCGGGCALKEESESQRRHRMLNTKATPQSCLYFIYDKNLVTFKRKSRGELTDLLSS
jgi:hypothetical protein